jgi:murein DD-endopeptidase MepM/ murein hydrolase activator NlpD
LSPPNISETSLLFVNEKYLCLIDDRYQRLLLLDKDTGNPVRQYVLRSGQDILAVYAEGDRLYIASRDTIYAYPGITTVLAGPEPNEGGPQLPDDPRILYTLPNFTLPIEGVLVPDFAFRLPGAPRAYRYGVHEGIDFYKGPSWGVTKDTPLLAMADGVVVRADWDYVDPTPDEMQSMLDEAYRAHYTSPEILDKLRGRQVWIDHGGGIVVRYCHMSRIGEGIELGTVVLRGTLLGYAGNSGTPEAKYGVDSGVHLHLEIRVGDGYLGEHLRPVEVVRWLEWLFRR